MNDIISIKKVTVDNHDHAAVKFNLDENISMSFIQNAVFSLIVAAIRPLEEEQKHMPNQKWHKIMSFIKSSIRITGYILIPFDLTSAAFVLIFSEIVGILEELV